MKNIRTIIATVSLALITLSSVFAGEAKNDHANDLNPDIKLEQWMMVITEFEAGLDAEMSFEKWMMSQLAFMEAEKFVEESMEIESWMTAPFDAKAAQPDDEIQFEEWMFGFSGLELERMDNEMELETWMMEID